MQGDSSQWDPWTFVRERHPRVQVIETTELGGRVLGCIDYQQRIIWLAKGMSDVQARCTLAFEIGQWQQGPTPADPCLAAAHRRDAEDWAARMLISAGQLVDACRAASTVQGAALLLEVDSATVRARFRGLTDDEQDQVMAALCAQQRMSA